MCLILLTIWKNLLPVRQERGTLTLILWIPCTYSQLMLYMGVGNTADTDSISHAQTPDQTNYISEVAEEIPELTLFLWITCTYSQLMLYMGVGNTTVTTDINSWAQIISMASCLITNPGNSVNMGWIQQPKERSYPWTNKQQISK